MLSVKQLGDRHLAAATSPPPGVVADCRAGRRAATDPHRSVTDALLAAMLTLFEITVLIGHQTSPQPLGWTLMILHTGCLAWRRAFPVAVLAVSAACYLTFEALSPTGAPLPIGVLVALYTVATMVGPVRCAVAVCVPILGLVEAGLIGIGGFPENFDDQFISFALSASAAGALGYGVQLTRARTELLKELATRLDAEHAAREQELLRLEQNRIAREMHDIVGHQISVITALAAGADRIFGTQPERARIALNLIETAGREALTEMRQLLHVLHPEASDETLRAQPNLAHLPALVDQITRAGIPVALSIDRAPVPAPAALQLCVYRIVQEALTNVLKHAGPCRAVVTLRHRNDKVYLEITDDGRGLSASSSGGHGLIGMHERARLARGRLTVDTLPDGGTRVRAVLPTDGRFA